MRWHQIRPVYLVVLLAGSVLGPVCWWFSGLADFECRRFLYRVGITKRDVPITELRDLRWNEGRLFFTYTEDMWDGNPDCTTTTKAVCGMLPCCYWKADGAFLEVGQVPILMTGAMKEGHWIYSTHGQSNVVPPEGAVYMAIDNIRHSPRKVRIPQRPPSE
jgi:hypothetical protein